ncbi:MAG TPA: peptidoglycan DD-metalloendopeptidase family protein [Candidatus Limnocylindrales bacterium]|nr:peptidoglycan DD-metalloendopeptidase family protein [Candidatus Limnocylindrales bacterium]
MRRSAPDPRGWSTRPKPIFGRRAVSLLIFVALIGGLFVSVTPPSASASDPLADAYAKQSALAASIAKSKAEIVSLTASQGALSLKISSTKASLAQVISNVSAVKAQIVGMVVDVAKAQATVDSMTTTIAGLDQQLADLQVQERAKAEQLSARKAILAGRIRSAYDTDRTSLLETVLSSSDFTDVISEVGYQLDFAGQDKALAEQIVTDQKVLNVYHQTVVSAREQTKQLHRLAATQKAVVDKQLKDLAAANAQLLRLEARTKQLLEAQQAAYKKLAANKAQLKANLAAAAKAQKQIEALIRKLVLAQLQKGGIPSQYSGSLLWPMPGIVTQEFGCTGLVVEPPLGSCAHFHKGIDIANEMDTPIRAAGAGKVLFAGQSPFDTAWIVVIAHSTHLVSWYGHIDNSPGPAVHVGQYVYTGQVIAYEGSTGNSTGPHLHWAIQIDDTWVNPRLFL